MSTHVPTSVEIAVVGAGVAGLNLARLLTEAGREVVVLESSDRIGGRVWTEPVDGFRLDLGFQVLATGHPELSRALDLRSLDVRVFDRTPASWIDGQAWSTVALSGDDRARLVSLSQAARSQVLPLTDLARLFRLRRKLARGEARRLLRGAEQSTAERLRSLGFGHLAEERFFGPLLGWLLHDPELATSSRVFERLMRTLHEGPLGVPTLGIARVPIQLADSLADETVLLDTAVSEVKAGRIVSNQGTVAARHVVIATDGPAASALLGLPDPGSLSTSCLWFAADIPPTTTATVILDGARSGPVAAVAPISNAAPSYAPAGRHLIATVCPGDTAPDLVERASRHLAAMFGPSVEDWRLLRVDRIAQAAARRNPPFDARQPVRLEEGLWVCGSHRDTGSLQGALFSARRTADAILGRPTATR